MDEQIKACEVTFDNVSSIMQTPELIVMIMLIWAIPLFLYLIIACTIKGRSSSGHATSKVMIAYPNAWYPMLIWGLIQLGLFLVLIFPIPLKFFD